LTSLSRFAEVGAPRGPAFYFISSTESSLFSTSFRLRFRLVTHFGASHPHFRASHPVRHLVGVGGEAESVSVRRPVGVAAAFSPTGALYLLFSAVLVNNFFQFQLRADSLAASSTGAPYLLAAVFFVNNFFRCCFGRRYCLFSVDRGDVFTRRRFLRQRLFSVVVSVAGTASFPSTGATYLPAPCCLVNTLFFRYCASGFVGANREVGQVTTPAGSVRQQDFSRKLSAQRKFAILLCKSCATMINPDV